MNCSVAQLWMIDRSRQPRQLFLQSFLVILSIASIFFTVKVWIKFGARYIEQNMRVLIYSKFIALILYSVLFAATQCYHLTNQALHNNCNLLTSVRICAAIRIPQSVASTFFQIFFGASSVSTILNMFSNRYHDSGLSYLLVLLSIFLACFGTVPSYFVDAKSDKYMLNCASFEHKRSEVQKSICFTFLLIDVVSGAATIIVSRIGKWKMSDPRLKLSITQKHRMANVKRSNILILPNVILNLCCYIGYVAINLWKLRDDDVVDGNEFLLVNTVPLYVFLSPFLWEYSLKHTKMKEKLDYQPTAENMAKILTAQWEKIDKNKERGNFFKVTGSGFIRVFICCCRNKASKAAKKSTENSTQVPSIAGNIPENSQVQQNHRQTIGRNEKVGFWKAMGNFLTGKKTNTVDVSVGYVNHGANNNDQDGGQIFFRTTQNV